MANAVIVIDMIHALWTNGILSSVETGLAE
jgi:hypothetical protein